MIEVACKEGEVSWLSYVLMYDCIQIWEDKFQKYGFQVWFNLEIEIYEFFFILELEYVNQWCVEVGLGLIEDYLS